LLAIGPVRLLLGLLLLLVITTSVCMQEKHSQTTMGDTGTAVPWVTLCLTRKANSGDHWLWIAEVPETTACTADESKAEPLVK